MDEKDLKILVQQVLKEVEKKSKVSDGNNKQQGVFETVDEAVRAAKRAQEYFGDQKLEVRRSVVAAVREKMFPFVEEIARKTVEETGMGRCEDKVTKLKLALAKTPGVEDLITEALTGDNGMTLYELSPYGVIGAITPSTNPAETLINNTIGMLAAGNSIFFSVHPGAKNISRELVSQLNHIIYEACGIQNLVVTIKEPSIEAAQEMMVHPDVALLVVTGGPGVVRQAMKSGKKVIGAGAGNPPAIVDETANIEKAARDIVLSAAFDNNILCTAEKSVVAVDKIVDYLILQMKKAGAYYVKDEAVIDRMLSMTLDEKGIPSRKYIGKNADFILREAGVSVEGDVRLIILRTEKIHPFVTKEMLMPILPVVSVKDFDEALETALAIENKRHHTATMHSQNIGRLNLAAKKFATSIFVKNGPSYAALGFGGEGPTTFTIATPTGEGTTSARHFARRRRCVLTDGFSIR